MIIFTIVIIIIFILIIRSYIIKNATLTNLSNATIMQTIPASSLGSSTTVGSSNFAFSIWFYISNWNYRYGEPKIIFGRMNSTTGSVNPDLGISGSGPSPLVSLGAISNDLLIAMAYLPTTESTATEDLPVLFCDIPNIPIQQWVNLTISIYGRTLDTYINGKLVKTCLLPGTASVNPESNVIVTPDGGFEGSTAKLSYYPNSLNPEQAWNIYQKGYGNSIFSNLFGKYQLNITLTQNGTEEGSITI
jgi:hypothetical protein